ncbi:MAG: hypothetical protein IPL78_16880, partial [Chloroflexi bacterium]|nr:hypothetical protein [Chloroflexota bacterium]
MRLLGILRMVFVCGQRRSYGAWLSFQLLDSGAINSEPAIAISDDGIVHLTWHLAPTGFKYRSSAVAAVNGDVLFQQALTIPASMPDPTLSFMHYGFMDRPGDGTQLMMQISNGTITETLATPVVQATWALSWADVSSWAGQSVT